MTYPNVNLLIDGKWRPSNSGRTIAVLNPATEEVVATVPFGTAADCDIVIEDGFMSARHCEIRKVDGGFKMVDLGATNGVVVNDKRVKEHFLVDNDNFRLGRTEFKFKSIFS